MLALLRRQKVQLQGLVRNTGVVFDALSARDTQLADAITNSNEAFAAISSEEQALSDTIQILPTTQTELKDTLVRLDAFQQNTLPLIKNLQPVADDISPTLRSVRRLSPSLKRLFPDLDALVKVSKTGLPALTSFINGLNPVLKSLDPFLSNLNPIISWLSYHKTSINDFLASPGAALSGTLKPVANEPSARHSLRQLGYISQESLSFYQDRLPTNRGDGYIPPFDQIIADGEAGRFGGFPSFDCNNTGSGERVPGDGKSPPVGANYAPCFLSPNFPDEFGGGRGPQVTADP